MKLDALDNEIIAALRAEPSRTKKDISAKLEVSEATVASRMASLERRKLLRVRMQRDIRAMGYSIIALMDIYVSGRKARDVAMDLAQADECMSLSLLVAKPEIMIHLIARDSEHLQQLIESKISSVPGVHSYETLTSLKVLKWDQVFGDLAAQ